MTLYVNCMSEVLFLADINMIIIATGLSKTEIEKLKE